MHNLTAQHEEVDGHLNVFPTSAHLWRDAKQYLRSIPKEKQSAVTIHTNQLCAIEPIDDDSMCLDVQTGIAMQALETHLNNNGFTLGPLSPLAFSLTLKEFLEGPMEGLRSIAMGRLEPITTRIEVVSKLGLIFETSRSPRSAVGPDLNVLFLGAAQKHGDIIAATVRIHVLPKEKREVSFAFESIEMAFMKIREAVSWGCHIARIDVTFENERVQMRVALEGSAAHVKREIGLLTRVMGDSINGISPEVQVANEIEVFWSQLKSVAKPMSLYRVALRNVLVCTIC